MCNVKGSAALVIATAAMMMFLTGCETTKHAEVMSVEELAARGQVVVERPEAPPAEPSGIPLQEPGISQGPLEIGERVVPGMPFDIEPELPPQPHLEVREEPIGPVTEAPVTPGILEPLVEAGPHGYEGQEFVRALTPSDFVPEFPPQPSEGEGVGVPEPEMAEKIRVFPEVEAPPGPARGEEIVRVPQQPSPEGELEPVMPGDLGLKEKVVSDLSHVYFDFDQFVIRSDAAVTLDENANLLKGNYKNSFVLIEGHCDERGTSEYNLVLGERRAQAVKRYLRDLGVSSSRIQIVSYGKERPSCTESEESCWQQNRRGHFVLQ
jgi:peptidoglycan-associated lipoprotein